TQRAPPRSRRPELRDADFHGCAGGPRVRALVADPTLRSPTPAATPRTKRERQRVIRELVARQPIASQGELAAQLRTRGLNATQATVSRDIADLGLVKVARGDRHVYVSPADLAPAPLPSDAHLRRIVADIPV